MNQFRRILNELSDPDRKNVQNTINGISNENRKLRNKVKNLERQAMPARRRLTYKAPILAVTEPVENSFGKSVQVEVAEILNSDLYRQILPIVGPLMEASVRTVQGSNLTRNTPLMQLGDDGRPSNQPLLDSDGNKVIAPSTLTQVREFYKFLLADPDIQGHIMAINRKVSSYKPSWKQYAPEFSGVIDPYQKLVPDQKSESSFESKTLESKTESNDFEMDL